jgi:peptide/nickel transport system permease protein
VRGDFGDSYVYRRATLTIIWERLLATVKLAFGSLFFVLFIGLSAGTISAINEYRLIDRLVMVVSFFFLAIPGFWLGLIFLYLFSFKLSWFPLGGYGGLRHLFLPSITMGLLHAPWYARMFRTSLLEVLKADYLITARAKGLANNQILLRHVLPNAIRPVITMAGMDLGQFLGGLIIIEIVFGWPGIGLVSFEAFQNMDVPLVMGTTLFVAFAVVVMNLIVDMSYGLIDPRVREGL